MIQLLNLSPAQLATLTVTRPRAVDPYNTVNTPPAMDTIEWDDSTVEAVVLETVPDLDNVND